MDSRQDSVIRHIKKYKRDLVNGNYGISLTDILQHDPCQQILSECREFRDRIYTPIKTIFTFIRQVLNADKSCKNVVATIAAEELKENRKKISENTGPYCKARQRIPEKSVEELVKTTGQIAATKSLSGWKPYGRNLIVFDGSTAKMQDTLANQQVFPQSRSQKEGVGFPITRFVVILSLTIGTVLNYAIGAYSGKGTGESSLLRSIFCSINKGDIALGDRYFPSFFLICDLKAVGADGIFRGQVQRHYDFRTGIRLGKDDHVATWEKPQKPEWMTDEEYAVYPSQIQVREFKVNGNVYVTTFLNSRKYHKQELSKLYERRWEVEISLKNIKDTMDMDFLTCKRPDMVKKEIGIHFLAYNFIRIMMAEACAKHQALPNKISFKGSVQLIRAFMPHFINSSEEKNKSKRLGNSIF